VIGYTADVSPVRVATDTVAAYGALRDEILRTRLRPGQPLNEADLMKRFAIGRTPLRDALHRLEHEGDRMVREAVASLFDGVRRVGVIRRITRRATILVESAAGARYSDGKRYEKFYVPLGQLSKLPA